MKPLHGLTLATLAASLLIAQPRSRPPIEHRIPPPAKIEVPAARLDLLHAELERARRDLEGADPDVEVFLKAARFALDYGEFYEEGDADKVDWAIRQARERFAESRAGRKRWLQARGTNVRGFRSAIDGAVQPYLVTISEKLDLSKPVPLYIWLHGRNDSQTDLHFIHDRSRNGPQGPMKDPGTAMILEPFGRQSLGWKSTGEIDMFEALAEVKAQYPIDEDRIVLMGYSMGGAGAWHIGAHYTEHFCAVQPGAGFVDLRRYQEITPDKFPAPYEQTLWSVYDVPDYVRNLFNIPVVAYNGENDRQRASAEIMAELYRRHGRELPHILGPGLGHVPARGKLLDQVLALVQPAMSRGRDRFPRELLLQTRTLRYNRMYWVDIEALDEHWRDTQVEARRAGSERVELTTRNVRYLRLAPPDGKMSRFPAGFEVVVNGKSVRTRTALDRLLVDAIARTIVDPSVLVKTAKRHGLQGPIDDVLLGPFLVVTPTGRSSRPIIRDWVAFELDHFVRRWRTLYRGELRIKKDTDVTADDIRKYHLILFGDAETNALVRRVLPGLPLRWDGREIQIAGRRVAASHHVAVMIHPNPLERSRYVVLNSGPTHREAHDHTNSLQNPKLPDWAIVDVRTPPSAEAPGTIVDADFFDESWRVKR